MDAVHLMLLRSHLRDAVAEAHGEAGAALLSRPREGLRPRLPHGSTPDFSCHLPVALARLQIASGTGDVEDAPVLARRLLALLQVRHADALHALVADARVSDCGELLFTSRAAAAAAVARGGLQCATCGRGCAGRRALRDHAQAAHGGTFVQCVAAVAAAVAARADGETVSAPPPPLPPALAAARDGDLSALLRLRRDDPAALGALDRHGACALMWAVGGGGSRSSSTGQQQQQRLACASLLMVALGPGAAARRQPRCGRTPLHWAARNGALEAVVWLLSGGGGNDDEAPAWSCDPGVPTLDGTTPLQLALWQGHTRVAAVLKAACLAWGGGGVGDGVGGGSNDGTGALPASPAPAPPPPPLRRWDTSNAYGCGPHHWAALGGHVGALEWLREEGGDGGAQGDGGWAARNAGGHTPLHKAAARGHDDAVVWLLALGEGGGVTAASAVDADGHTPLDLACLWNQRGAARLLLLAAFATVEGPAAGCRGAGWPGDGDVPAARAAAVARGAGHHSLADDVLAGFGAARAAGAERPASADG